MLALADTKIVFCFVKPFRFSLRLISQRLDVADTKLRKYIA